MLLGASVLGLGWIGFRPAAEVDAPVAVVFPPWWSADHSFAAAAEAGGTIVRQGAWSDILVVQPVAADFAHRVRAAGAWLLLNPKALDACLKE